MPSLMDALTSSQSTTAAGAAGGQPASAVAGTGASSATSRLGQLLGAKTGTGGPISTQENLSESAQGAATKQEAQLGAAAVGADVQAQKTAATAQQTQIAQAKTQESQAFEAQQGQFGAQAKQTLATLAAGEDQLTLQKNQQAAEVLGFQMRLSNDQYVTRLNQEADKRRMDDQSSFQEELYKTELGASLDTLKQKLGSDVVLAGDAATFQSSLAKLHMQDWLTMAQYEAKSAAAAGVLGGLGSMAGPTATLAGGSSSTPASTDTVYSDAGGSGMAPERSAQNPSGPASVDSSGNANPGYQSPSRPPAYTPPGGSATTQDQNLKAVQPDILGGSY